MLLVLTCAAGLVDAISYLEMGHVFTAMMTGNTVLLALAIGQGEVMAALRSTLALVAFSVGAAGAAMVLRRDRARDEWPRVVTATLALEAVALGVFAVMWHVKGPAPRGDSVTLVLICFVFPLKISEGKSCENIVVYICRSILHVSRTGRSLDRDCMIRFTSVPDMT